MYIFGMYILYNVVFVVVIMLYVKKCVCIFVLEIGEVYFVIFFLSNIFMFMKKIFGVE